jgi:hypothetical protein
MAVELIRLIFAVGYKVTSLFNGQTQAIITGKVILRTVVKIQIIKISGYSSFKCPIM